MKNREELLKALESIDHKGYPAYKSLAGTSGTFFHAADTVIQMDHDEPEDITERVKTLCLKPDCCFLWK